jgi:hypothetical protein
MDTGQVCELVPLSSVWPVAVAGWLGECPVCGVWISVPSDICGDA